MYTAISCCVEVTRQDSKHNHYSIKKLIRKPDDIKQLTFENINQYKYKIKGDNLSYKVTQDSSFIIFVKNFSRTIPIIYFIAQILFIWSPLLMFSYHTSLFCSLKYFIACSVLFCILPFVICSNQLSSLPASIFVFYLFITIFSYRSDQCCKLCCIWFFWVLLFTSYSYCIRKVYNRKHEQHR